MVLLPAWRDPAGVELAASGSDTALNEWNLSYAAHVLAHGGNPFFTTDLNPPAGVNLMANTSVLGLGVPFAPLTLAARPRVVLAAHPPDTAERRTPDQMANGDIGRRLHLSEATVKSHVSRVLAKLQLTNRVQAAILAHHAGLVP